MIPSRNDAPGRDRGTAGAGPRRRAAAIAGAILFVAFFGGIAALIVVFTRDDAPRTASTAPADAAATPAGGLLPAVGGLPVALAPELAIVPSPGAAAEHLARAQSLAQAHRETAAGSTLQGAKQAEAEVLEAFRLGAADIPGAWRILADVYDVQIEWTPSAAGRAEYRAKVRDALSRTLELDPGDAEARYQYAILLEDRNARMFELARVVRELPGDPLSRRALAEDLLAAKRLDEAAPLLVEAAQLYSPLQLRQQGRFIVRTLRARGREREAELVSARMKQVLGGP